MYESRETSGSAGLPSFEPKALRGLTIGAMRTGLPEDAAEASQQIAAFHGIAFASAFHADFLKQLQGICRTGVFLSDQSEPGHREVESPQRAGIAINLALNRPEFLRWLEEVTECGPLREIAGRVVQTFPRPGDELRWHDDLSETQRRLAITINLGEESFEGGEFELRRKGGETLLRHRHTEAGSMLIFDVKKALEHRVMPLTAGGPRRVYTGWAYRAEEA